MPPIPILVLLSVVGFALYFVIGGVLAPVFITLFSRGDFFASSGESYLRAIAGREGGDRDGWQGFWFSVILWPMVLGFSVIGLVVYGLGYGPFWLARSVGRYVASAKIKEG